MRYMVQIKQTTGYGLTACVNLAKDGGLMSARQLAGKAGVSASYLAQILNRLRAGRVVTSTGGVKGGYRLSRSANEITIGEIIKSIEGPPAAIPPGVPKTVRKHLKQACRELYAIRLSDL